MRPLQYNSKRLLLIPLLVFIVVAGLFVTYWRIADRSERQLAATRLGLTADQVAVRLGEQVRTRLQLVEHLRDQWAGGVIVDEQSFVTHASALQRRFAGIVALNWVDPDGYIRWVVPEKSNVQAKNRNLKVHPVAGAVLQRARETGGLQVTPPLELYQGGVGFAVYVPIEQDGRFLGYVNAAFRSMPLIERCLTGVEESFFVAVADDGRTIHTSDSEDRTGRPSATRQLSVGNRTWDLALTLRPELAGRTATDEVIAALGILLGLGTAYLSWRLIRSRAELQSSRARYMEVVEDMPALICRFKPDTTLTFVNTAYAEYFGRTPEELTGTRFLDLIPSEAHQSVRDTIASLGPQNPSVTYEHEVLGPDGIRWQQWRDRALFDADGRIVEFQSIGIDTTERHESEIAIRDSEEKFRAIFGSVSDAIFIFDERGRLLDVNERACELHGYSRKEMIALDVQGLSSDRQPNPVALRWFDALDDDRPRLFEWDALHRSGRVWRAEVNLRRTTIGGQPRLLAVVRDISHRRELEQQLRQAQKMEAVGTLAAGIAHDFNNILTAIMGHAEIARSLAPPDSQVGGALQGIADACEQAAGVTRSLLTFSRKQVGERLPVELARLVTSTVRMLRPLLPDSIELVASGADAVDVWVHADRAQLQQVLMNLALNSRDAMPDGGSLEIELGHDAAVPGGAAILTVKDSGVGMPDDVRERVIEPFFTTKPRERGTGLGLSVVHGIVVEHGGDMQIASRVGRGTSVTIRLPCCEPQMDRAVPTRFGDLGGGDTVLVVEDNTQVRELIVQQLENIGYDVIQSADGVEAIAALERRREPVRLVIMDVDLPKMNGVSCLRQIRRSGWTAPAILISGNVDVDLTDDLAESVVFLAKPFSFAELARRAAEVLDRTVH